ncbi:hypothetical protein [Pseudooceanicola atlanticus]|nr:hypothetical protein [Pseudooceanicola atlanticus]
MQRAVRIVKFTLDCAVFPARAIWWICRRALKLVMLLVLCIGVSIATLTFDAVTDFAQSATTKVASVLAPSASKPRSRLSKAMSERDAYRREASDLKVRTSAMDAELRQLRTDNASLRSRNQSLTKRASTSRAETRALKGKVGDLSRRMASRTAKVTGANIASMGAESLPFIGVAVVVAATTYEVKSACDTMHDLSELELAVDPMAEIDPDTVCGISVPSRDEVLVLVKSSPGMAWDKAKEVYSGLPSMPSMPSMPDWNIRETVGNGWNNLGKMWPFDEE